MNGFSDWFENNWIDLARLLVQLAIFAAVVRYGGKLLATLRASQEQLGALLRLSVSDSAPAAQTAPASEPESSKRLEAPAAKIWEAEPEAKPVPEPEPEPVFAGSYSRPSYAAERDSRPSYPAERDTRPSYPAERDTRPSYSAEREQSLGGRLAGAQAPAFAASAQREPFAPSPQREPFAASPQREPFAASERGEMPALTPWVSAPAMEPERLNIPTAPLAPRPAASSWLQTPMRSHSVNPWRKMVRWLQAPVRR